MGLRGRVGVITGGTLGIGRAVAESMLAEGMKVMIGSRNVERVQAAVEELGPDAAGEACDVRDPQSVQAFVDRAAERFGGIDVLVNNAGLGRFAPIQEMSHDDWTIQIETNLNGVFYASKAAIPHLKERGGGWIINIGSLASRNAFAGGAAYNASKFGLLGLNDAMMLDLRPDGIRVSIVMPGSVETHFFGDHGGEGASWRLGADDIARAVMDLLRYPGRALPSRIELRPSQPPQ